MVLEVKKQGEEGKREANPNKAKKMQKKQHKSKLLCKYKGKEKLR
jgi:hypothetical protein